MDIKSIDQNQVEINGLRYQKVVIGASVVASKLLVDLKSGEVAVAEPNGDVIVYTPVIETHNSLMERLHQQVIRNRGF